MRAFAVMAMIVGLVVPSCAQDQQPGQPSSADTPANDAANWDVSLARNQKALRTAEAREKTKDPEGLRLEFNVQVFGIAPRIDVIPDGEDLVFGPVPGTAPSHPQFLEFVTPAIYRQPAMPISSFAALAAKWMADRSKRSAERRV